MIGTTSIMTALWATTPVVVMAVVSPEDDAFVRDTVARAAAEVDKGRYEAALQILSDAEKRRPHAVYVFVRATIEERRGNCRAAIDLYEHFLQFGVPEADAEEARLGISRCREALPSSPTGPETTPTQTSDPSPEPEDPDAAKRRWHLDPLGGALLLTGVAGLGTGLGLYVQSRSDERAANDADTLEAYEAKGQRARRFNAAGIAMLGVGSALIVGAIVRYTLVATSERRAQVAIGWGRDLPTLGVRARF